VVCALSAAQLAMKQGDADAAEAATDECDVLLSGQQARAARRVAAARAWLRVLRR
jgi:hypothetical protein